MKTALAVALLVIVASQVVVAQQAPVATEQEVAGGVTIWVWLSIDGCNFSSCIWRAEGYHQAQEVVHGRLATGRAGESIFNLGGTNCLGGVGGSADCSTSLSFALPRGACGEATGTTAGTSGADVAQATASFCP